MSGAAATAKGFVQGNYSKTAKENGKLTWTKGNHALWFSTNGLWIVGNKGSIGGSSGFIFDRWADDSEVAGLPYALENEFAYYNGSDWVKPINEIFVRCTSLETVGKFIVLYQRLTQKVRQWTKFFLSSLLGQVSCGNHQEDSCADCPGDKGQIWCNGDCKWVNGNCLSKGMFIS